VNGLKQWRYRWGAANAATIPLGSNSKWPVSDAWQVRSPVEQWGEAGPNFRGNIGVRVGNGLAVLDADSPETVVNLEAYLEGLGLQLPKVITASGTGRHYYLPLEGAPDEFNWAHLSPAVGPGELRVRNAYVVAPCSMVDGVRYQFVSGGPETIPTIRPVRYRDLIGLLSNATSVPSIELEAPPVRLLRRDMPPKARWLLGRLRGARQGQRVGTYPSRSEAEAAVVAMLILAGWDFAEIAAEFERCQPGHYREKGKHREHYLHHTYRSALMELAARPTERAQIAAAYQQVPALLWPDRTRDLDLAIYEGLLAIAWQFSTWKVHASLRDLALYAGRSLAGVHDALGRLQEAGWVRRLERGKPGCGTLWYVIPEAVANSNISHSSLGIVEQVVGQDTGEEEIVWVQVRPSSRAVYRSLNGVPMTAAELAQLTGKHKSTVGRALKELQMFDLAVATSTTPRGDRTGWMRGSARPADLAAPCTIHRARFEREREEFRERCLRKGGESK
jgi:hypothetical protein